MNLVQVVVDAILGPGCALAGSATDERRADARLPRDWPRGAVTQGRPHFPRPKVAHPRGSVRRGGAGGEMTRKGGVGSPPHSPPILLRLWASLPSSLDASPVPFLALSPNVGGKVLKKGQGKGKTVGHGETGEQLRNDPHQGQGWRGGSRSGWRRSAEGLRPRSPERTARAQLQLSAGAGAGRAWARPSVRTRGQLSPASSGGACGAEHLGGLAVPTSPRGLETVRREKERSARAKPRRPSLGLRLHPQRLLPPLPPPAGTPSLAKPPPRRSHTSL